jgi:dUTP pyrophosphatase
MIWLKFKRIHPDAKLPRRATPGSSGLDVFTVEDYYVYAEKVTVALTGLQVEIPSGYELQVRPRSGLVAAEGVTVANAPGTIDSDYRGEIKILLFKMTPGHAYIQKGTRVAQLVLTKIEELLVEEADELSDTGRGSGGFGSSGK